MTPAPAAPLPLWQVPARWRAIDFISDLHLAPGLPRTLQALASLLQATDADALVLLGDVFEVWVGDDARHQAFERSVVELLHQASARIELFVLPGNRDFLLGDELCAAAGLQLLHDPTCLCGWGRRWVLAHGDALCLSDVDYQAFRRQVRSPAWQAAFLARPLAERLEIAARMRQASQERRLGAAEGFGDVDDGACIALLQQAGASALVHGHTHRPDCHGLDGGRSRWVLSDWDLDGDPPRADVIRLSCDGMLTRRSVLPAAIAP